MKKLYVFFLIVFMTLAMSVAAASDDPVILKITDSKVYKSGDMLKIGFTVDYSELAVSKNEQLMVQPVIISFTDTLRLPFLLFPGKTRDKVNKRKLRLYGQEGQDLLLYQTVYPVYGQSALVSYQEEIPFENWMYGATLELQQDIYGCADCHRVLASIPLNYIARPPQVSFIVPAADNNRKEEVTVAIGFPWDQAVILPSFGNNSRELEKINQCMEKVLQARPGEVNRIHLSGYASPEGSYEYNTRLAGKRMLALKQYIYENYPVEEELFTMDIIPEDWSGVRRWVDSSDLTYRRKVMDIIDETADPDARDSQIRQLDRGATYRFLLRRVYPSLRRTEYQVYYRVAPFTPEQSLRMYREHPEQLSANELYSVALLYPQGSPEFNEIILTTVRLYPQDAAANNNAAALALQRNDLQEAGKYLKRAGDKPEIQNNKGVLLQLEGDLSGAIRCYQKGKECHCPEAEQNLANALRINLYP